MGKTKSYQMQMHRMREKIITAFAITPESAVILTAILIFAVVLIRSAWVGDDAYFTARTLDNWINGYGLTWNIGERVQAYTHPLWLFTLLPLFALTKSFYFTVIFLSLFFSVATIVLFVTRVTSGLWAGLLSVSIITMSKAFVDYSTSGLENPLSYFLLTLFLISFFQEDTNIKGYLRLSFLASLVMLNRIDAILLVLPALVYKATKLKFSRVILATIVGFMPVIIWELFSLIYYGFPFPNTAYAKLATGISRSVLFKQGALYFMNSLDQDPITLIVMVLGCLIALFIGDGRNRSLAAGIALYGLYIVSIGGDFMSGRFFGASLLMAVAILGRAIANIEVKSVLLLIGLVIVIGFSAPNPTLLNNVSYSDKVNRIIDINGIADERAFYFSTMGLLKAQRNQAFIHEWGKQGRKAHEIGETIAIRTTAGFFGYYAGPTVYIVELTSLTNPLLARLPIADKYEWRVGHYPRELPEGYLETLETGENVIKDPNLRLFYDKLQLIVRGNIWDFKRIVEIWNINTGRYNELLDSYIETSGL
jgi:arabinofuranosyltransferase